jgi:type IV pilus assembly protein PilV
MAQMALPGKKSSGFTLVEVLVALSIFSLVLLGLMRMQLFSTQKNLHAYYESIATIQAASMLDRLRANANVAFRERALEDWNDVNQSVLPNGHGDYTCSLYQHTCTVTLQWYASKKEAFALTGGVANEKI